MLEYMSNTPYAMWVKQSWGWPFALTFHAFGNATVICLTFIIGLRLLGLFRTIPYTSLSKLFPIIWFAIVIQILSGSSLLLTKPERYLVDGMFEWKLTFVISGAIVTYYLQKTLKREAAGWEASGKVSTRGYRIVAVACLLWAAVLVTGRLTAYLGQLYHV